MRGYDGKSALFPPKSPELKPENRSPVLPTTCMIRLPNGTNTSGPTKGAIKIQVADVEVTALKYAYTGHWAPMPDHCCLAE